MKTRKILAAAVLATATMTLGATPASAYLYIGETEIGQARAYNNSSSSGAYAGAWDNAADQMPVYNTYYRAASSSTERNLWNKLGGGTLTTSGTGSPLIKMRICESVPLFDPCSDWRYM